MFEERKVNVCEGVPLNSAATGAANIFLNTGITGKNTKAKSDGTAIHLDTANPTDIGVHINTTLSIASSKKIRLMFILNFLLSVICIVISGTIAFYYWNEMVSMRRQVESMKEQFMIQSLGGGQQDRVQQSALISHLRPAYRGSDIREPRMDTGLESPSVPKKYYVEDLGDDMLLVDSKKKTNPPDVTPGGTPIDKNILARDPLIVHFNGAMDEIHLGKNSIIGPWERDLSISSNGSESKIELHNNYVTIQETGVYLIYAQIVYLSRGPNCYFIFARTSNKGRLLSTCATGDDSTNRELNQLQMSCGVQTVARLTKGDTVNIAQREPNRTLWLRRGNSYLGFIKLSS